MGSALSFQAPGRLTRPPGYFHPMPPAQPILQASGIVRRFGAVAALRGVDFAVGAGELVLLLGPNGAGKTTLLRCLAGLAHPQRGAVRILGADVHAEPATRGAIGLLSHQSHLYDDLTAGENLRFAAALYDLHDGEALIRHALDAVGLQDQIDRRVATFSRGMLQRLAIARATLHGPPLLLLDEPFTGLDTHAAAALRDRLATAITGERAVVCVTHEPGELWERATRVVVLVGGMVKHDVPRPDDLERFRHDYRQLLTA
jgi:heme ABC exporter ATP-binding subunit CcmA